MSRQIQFPIKGTFYYSAELALDLDLVQQGTLLKFRAEPDNRFDQFAIQIWLPTKSEETESGYLLGYVPKVMSKKLSLALQKKPHTGLNVTHIAQRGKYIEIDCLLSIQQPVLPHLYLSILSAFASKMHRLKRLTQNLLS